MWLRLYDHDARTVAGFLASIGARVRDANLRLVVGMRLDLAIASSADGVHLPAHGMDVADARLVLGARALLIGASCHDERELGRAADADYVTVSPVHGVPGKGPSLGSARFAELARVAGPPVIALGGITIENAATLVRDGAHGVALSRAVDASPDPGETIRRMSDAVAEASTTISTRGGSS